MHRHLVNTADDGSLYNWIPLVEMLTRTQEVQTFSGLGRDELIVSRFCNTPLPGYPSVWEEGCRRWANVRPEAMWHPLMWLPDDIAGRYVDIDDVVESDDLWALRVALEMTERQLFDPTTGGWVDLLAMNGISVDDPSDVERIRRWLDGAADSTLDRIELPPARLPEGMADLADWALISAQALIGDLAAIYLVRDAEEFSSALEEVLDAVIEGDQDGFASAAEIVANLATFAASSFDPYEDADPGWWDNFAVWATRTFRPLVGVTMTHARSDELRSALDDPLIREAMERLSLIADTDLGALTG